MRWQPGDLTAAQLQDEWVEEHGWAVEPPESSVARWREVAAAEAAHAAAASSVEEAETTTVGTQLPEVVVVPAHPRPDGSRGFDIELTESNGRPLIPAFSSVDGLVETLGEHQPWLGLTPAQIGAVYSGISIVLDPVPRVVQKLWSADRLAALQEEVR
ncbi:SseB family protein [uncultured Williamsia sp.]|uniref:SseB family protein n=1 Tax=uncultured Williamsia sp. TaxID=259311 RepID=UPI002639E806|nr:SseB family protein [uncultured Williamsia sp.]